MKKFDKEHEEKVAMNLLTHAMIEAQLTPEYLTGPTFSSDRATFLIRTLSKIAARGLAFVEAIASKNLSDYFLQQFTKNLEEARKNMGICFNESTDKGVDPNLN